MDKTYLLHHSYSCGKYVSNVTLRAYDTYVTYVSVGTYCSYVVYGAYGGYCAIGVYVAYVVHKCI
jgi:hypothetical protein